MSEFRSTKFNILMEVATDSLAYKFNNDADSVVYLSRSNFKHFFYIFFDFWHIIKNISER